MRRASPGARPARPWLRDGLPAALSGGPGALPAGARFVSAGIGGTGLALSLRRPGLLLRNLLHGTALGADATACGLAVFKQTGHFTPCASLARQVSRQRNVDRHDRRTGHPLPAAVPAADRVNAARRAAAAPSRVSAQHARALGGAWALTPQARRKAEWLRTRTGRVSRMVDTAAGQATPQDTAVAVLSVNQNHAF